MAVDEKGGISKGQSMPWPKNSIDLKWFKENTINNIVVMGRKTWEDPFMPTPLKSRINVLITSKDKELIDVARAYYYERDGTHYEDDEAVVESFIDDRTWKQANSYSIGKELLYATSDAVNIDQKRRLQYLETNGQFWMGMG